jgi:HD-like signal output (HDOD) protein
MPGVVGAIHQAAQRDDMSAQELAAEVARDPAVAARLIRVANSSLYGGVHRVATLTLAIARIGLPSTRRLILALSLAGATRPVHPQMRELLARQWKRSVEIAALSKVLAEHYTGIDPDEAFLAGLVHRIGILPIISIADTIPPIAMNPAIVDGVIEKLQVRLSTWLLNVWRFPAAMVSVPAGIADPARAHPGAADLCDVVSIAAVNTAGGGSGPDLYPPHAWHKLKLHEVGGLVLGVNVSAQIEEARALFE